MMVRTTVTGRAASPVTIAGSGTHYSGDRLQLSAVAINPHHRLREPEQHSSVWRPTSLVTALNSMQISLTIVFLT